MTDRTFEVKNFDRFQHYKDRSPPWIKLYNELLDNYDFARLQDASKAHLILIWLLASRSDNKLPYDAAWIGSRIGATGTVDLDGLVESGFLVVHQSRSKPLARRKQTARPETERETEEERETEQRKKEPPAAASAKANGHHPPAPSPLAELSQVLDPERSQAVVDHRRKLRKPLTAHAAGLLARKFAACPDPNEAADAMIANGWQGIEPSWLVNRSHRTTAPPGKRTAFDAGMDWIAEGDNAPNCQSGHRDDVKLISATSGKS